jgi:hypothetical protein
MRAVKPYANKETQQMVVHENKSIEAMKRLLVCRFK